MPTFVRTTSGQFESMHEFKQTAAGAKKAAATRRMHKGSSAASPTLSPKMIHSNLVKAAEALGGRVSQESSPGSHKAWVHGVDADKLKAHLNKKGHKIQSKQQSWGDQKTVHSGKGFTFHEAYDGGQKHIFIETPRKGPAGEKVKMGIDA